MQIYVIKQITFLAKLNLQQQHWKLLLDWDKLFNYIEFAYEIYFMAPVKLYDK